MVSVYSEKLQIARTLAPEAESNRDDNGCFSECRNYRLNEEKTMKKLLNATKNPMFELTETGGGVKLVCSKC